MIYIVSQKISTFGLLEFCAGNVLGREDFEREVSLSSFCGTLRYRLRKRSDRAKLDKLHLIDSAAAPTLVSDEFRRTIEHLAPGDAEFVLAEFDEADRVKRKFWAINLLSRLPCIDMERSEFEQINFDPADPRYTFSYTVMLRGWNSSALIARCAEQRNRIAVLQPLKEACFQDGLTGLVFYEALDMTYGDRTVGSSIP